MASITSRIPDNNDPHMTDWLNVVKMGIINNGITDVTSDLQALIDAVPEFSVLFFPSGVYRLSGGIILDKNVTLIGNHMGQYAWSSTQDTYSCLSLDAGVTNTTILTVTNNGNRCVLKDFMLASQSATFSATGSVPIADNPNPLFALTVVDEGVNGLDMSPVLGMTVENVMVRGCSGYGIKSGIVNYVRNVTAFQCGTGYLVDKDSRIDHPFVSACNVGMEIVGANNNIFDAWIDQIITYGILIKGSRNMVSVNFDQIGYAAIKTTGDLTISRIKAIGGRVGQYYAGNYLATIAEGEYDKCSLLHNGYKIYGCNLELVVSSLVANDAGTAGLCPSSKIVSSGTIERTILEVANTGESATDFAQFALLKNLGTISASHIATGGTNEIRYFYDNVPYQTAVFTSGAGVPTISGYAGSFYINTVDNKLYVNIYGGATWAPINTG